MSDNKKPRETAEDRIGRVIDEDALRKFEETMRKLNEKIDIIAKNATPANQIQEVSRNKLAKPGDIPPDVMWDELQRLRADNAKLSHNWIAAERKYATLEPYAESKSEVMTDFHLKVNLDTASFVSLVTDFSKEVVTPPGKNYGKNLQKIIIMLLVASVIAIGIISFTQPQVLQPLASWLVPSNNGCQYSASQAGQGITNATQAQVAQNQALNSCLNNVQNLGYEHQAELVLSLVGIPLIIFLIVRRFRK